MDRKVARRGKKSNKVKLFHVKSCHECPNVGNERTQGAGYAVDYFCKITGTLVAGYVEWQSDHRADGDFPKDCPLKTLKVDDKSKGPACRICNDTGKYDDGNMGNDLAKCPACRKGQK